MQGDRDRALAAGCDGFIPKPIDEETFGRQIAAYLRPGRDPGEPPRDGAAANERNVEPGRDLVVDDHPGGRGAHPAGSGGGRARGPRGHHVRGSRRRRSARRPAFDLAIVDVMLGGRVRVRADGGADRAVVGIPAGPARDGGRDRPEEGIRGRRRRFHRQADRKRGAARARALTDPDRPRHPRAGAGREGTGGGLREAGGAGPAQVRLSLDGLPRAADAAQHDHPALPPDREGGPHAGGRGAADPRRARHPRERGDACSA